MALLRRPIGRYRVEIGSAGYRLSALHRLAARLVRPPSKTDYKNWRDWAFQDGCYPSGDNRPNIATPVQAELTTAPWT
jgi:hypothetical protein